MYLTSRLCAYVVRSDLDLLVFLEEQLNDILGLLIPTAFKKDAAEVEANVEYKPIRLLSLSLNLSLTLTP
jgi:hypothetical protein